MKTLRKYHKWPSLIVGIFLLLTATSGIVMNHRNWFASVDFPRQLMPPDYHYRNWNLASLRGNLELSDGSQLLYGNIGIYRTSMDFTGITDFNRGFGKGMDKRKIFTMLQTAQGELLAGTLFGLYRYNGETMAWEQMKLPGKPQRVVKLIQNDNRIYILTRSHLYSLPDGEGLRGAIAETYIPPADNDDGKAGLFRTLWIVHSGEIFGLTGKILVDLIGLIVIFFVLSGFYYTFLPGMARRTGEATRKKLKRINRFNIRWHNKIGVYALFFLLITTVTGMFLRPPLLIPIAGSRVEPIPGSVLSGENRWDDKFRDMIIDREDKSLILSTSEGFYRYHPETDSLARAFTVQPDVSVMGINAFGYLPDGSIMVGSFSGMYRWYPETGIVLDYLTGLPAKTPERGNPFGSLAIAGVITRDSIPVSLLEYDAGWIPLKRGKQMPEMPAEIRKLPVSLWNLSLEVHTGRIFSVILGDFYILYVPLLGITTLVILISGILLWWKMRKKKNKKQTEGVSNENRQTA